MWPFKRKTEKRAASNAGYTMQMMQARASFIAGTDGLAELTSTVQGAVSLWEGGFTVADVTGTDLLTRHHLALLGRALALRGEAVFYMADTRLIPASDWDMTTRFSRPVAYRLGLPDVGGGRTVTALADEVLHVRIGCDVTMPYSGTSPLRRSGLTAGLLHHVESALSEVYQFAPIGSQIVPFPESAETDLEGLARGFRGSRGKVLIRESVNVAAAGGPAPILDWKPHDTTPDLQRAMTRDTLQAARDSIQHAYGVLPGLTNLNGNGPMVREAQRHIASWTLQPIAELVAEEATEKLGTTVTMDLMRPLQAYDAGGRARAVAGVVQALTQAKEAGVDPTMALKLVDWKEST